MNLFNTIKEKLKLGPKFILVEVITKNSVIIYKIYKRVGLFYELERTWYTPEMKQCAMNEFNKMCEAHLNRNKKRTSKVLMKSEF